MIQNKHIPGLKRINKKAILDFVYNDVCPIGFNAKDGNYTKGSNIFYIYDIVDCVNNELKQYPECPILKNAEQWFGDALTTYKEYRNRDSI